MSISLYYVSFLGLFIARVTQTAYQFSAINDLQIKNAIVASDGFSVCIGLAQVCLIADLIITL